MVESVDREDHLTDRAAISGGDGRRSLSDLPSSWARDWERAYDQEGVSSQELS